jgi:hypothetical protein
MDGDRIHMENTMRVQPITKILMNQQSASRREAMGRRKKSEGSCLFADILMKEIDKQRNDFKR